MPRRDAISHMGLEYYLNLPHSVAKHNGQSYEDFVKAVDLPEPLRVNKTRLAALFGVSVVTIDKWIKVWEDERS